MFGAGGRVVAGSGNRQGGPTAAAVVLSDSNQVSIETNTTTTLTITKPSGTVDGDLLIAQIGTPGNSINTPAGWTLIKIGSNFGVSRLFSKQAGASEPATYSWTIGATSGTQDSASGGIMRISGHNPSNPVDLVNNRSGNSDTPQTYGGTASTEFALRLRFAIILNGAATFGNLWGGLPSIGHAAIAAQKDAATTSVVPEYTFANAGGNDDWVGQLLVINPLGS